MDGKRLDTGEVRRRFERLLQQLGERDAGAHVADPDQPMHDFNEILDAAAIKPIESEDQLQILLRGIAYLLETEVGAPSGSMDDLLDKALGDAIAEAETSLQGALLALVRHRLRGGHLDVPSTPLPVLGLRPAAARPSRTRRDLDSGSAHRI